MERLSIIKIDQDEAISLDTNQADTYCYHAQTNFELGSIRFTNWGVDREHHSQSEDVAVNEAC